MLEQGGPRLLAAMHSAPQSTALGELRDPFSPEATHLCLCGRLFLSAVDGVK